MDVQTTEILSVWTKLNERFEYFMANSPEERTLTETFLIGNVSALIGIVGHFLVTAAKSECAKKGEDYGQ